MIEHNLWEKEKDLENTKEVVVKFERRLNAEVKTTRKVGYSRRKRLEEKRITRKIYSKDIV